MTLTSYFRNYKTEQTVFRYLFLMDRIQFCHMNYDNHYDHVRATSGHNIFDQNSIFGKYSVHEDRPPRWGSIFTLMKNVMWLDPWLMSCKFMRWQREASLHISLDIIVFIGWMRPSVDDDDVLQLIFDCKKCVTTAIRSDTWEQARFFWHRRLDEFLLSLIFSSFCLSPSRIATWFWCIKKEEEEEVFLYL